MPHIKGSYRGEQLKLSVSFEIDIGPDAGEGEDSAAFQPACLTFRDRREEGHPTTRASVEGHDVVTFGMFYNVDDYTFNFFNHKTKKKKV